MLLVFLVPAAFALAGGYVLKNQCTTHQWDGFQYRHSCYNDIYALYFFRDLNKGTFPYISSTEESRRLERDVEYPVGTGLYMGAVAKTTSTAASYFNASALGLAVAGLVAVGVITLMAGDGRRVLYFALAPAVVLYAFHNWDLLAVMLTSLGLYAFWRGRDGPAGAALGAGAAAKLYPAFILPALLLARRREGKPLGPMIAGFALTSILFNVPVFLANRQGWWYPWKFQSKRFTNFETVWYMIYRHARNLADAEFWFKTYPVILNFGTGVLFLAGVILLLRAESKRDRFRPYAVSFGLLLVWLLTAKVFSPQYALWLLPFFVLLRIPWYGFAAFAVTDAAVWWAISGYFLVLARAQEAGVPAPEFRLTMLEIAVFARYAVLLWLLWMSRRAEERVAPAPSTGPATVSGEEAASLAWNV